MTTTTSAATRPLALRPWEARRLAGLGEGEGGRFVLWRPVVPQPEDWSPADQGIYHPLRSDRKGEAYPADARFGIWGDDWDIPCPLGGPGDLLWCRETWARQDSFRDHSGRDPDAIWYRADGQARFIARGGCSLSGDEPWDADTHEAEIQVKTLCGGWRPSATMPKWASRTTLAVVAVDVRRVSGVDAGAAEVKAAARSIRESLMHLDGRAHDRIERLWCRATKLIEPDAWVVSDKGAFAAQWGLDHGKAYPWASDPWAWRVEVAKVGKG